MYFNSNAGVNVNLLTNTVSGDNTANSILGYDGNDTLYGNDGDDILYGGVGLDGLVGGAGDDELYGGLNVDWFWFWGTSGDDTIKDWDDGVDKINLSNTSLIWSDLTLSTVAGDVVLSDNYSNNITFYGITTGISADDIIFS